MIGLHRQAKSIPARECTIAQGRGDNIERQFEPVGLFGVDRELQIVIPGEAREFDEPRRQFFKHAFARDRLVARVQR